MENSSGKNPSLERLKVLREKCGIIAVSNDKKSVYNSLLGLHALQHRGHEAFGIATYSDSAGDNANNINNNINNNIDNKTKASPGAFLKKFYAEGTVAHSINKVNITGDYAIGHVRYSTSGGLNFAQPICAKLAEGEIALAHNGNLINAAEIRDALIKEGNIFQSDVDTEVFIHLIAKAKAESLIEKIIIALKQIRGAYSLVLLFGKKIFAIRDPFGIRPLVLGKITNLPAEGRVSELSYIIASETCALDILNADFIRDIVPGEILEIEDSKITSYFPFEKQIPRFCIFEYVYFARADSFLEGKDVYSLRRAIGRQLAIESKHLLTQATDMVVPILDSGMPAALGFAREVNIPLEIGIIKNSYSGRTFIEPTQENRYLKVKLKHNSNRALLKGKHITVIDDSIVRGTTLKQLIKILKEAEVASIHVRISSPQMLNPCYYGVDTPDKAGLLAANYSLQEMQEFFEVDSLYFLSLAGLHEAVHNNQKNNYCDACFSGNYPIKI